MADNKRHYEIKGDMGVFKVLPSENKIEFTPKVAYEGYKMVINYPKSWGRSMIFSHIDNLMNVLEQTSLF